MENSCMITTFDNPYNPFVDFSLWYMSDCENGHNTCGRLARLLSSDNEMTEKEVNEERIRVIDFMIEHDAEGIYFKGTEEDIDKWLKKRNSAVKNEENVEKQTATATNA